MAANLKRVFPAGILALLSLIWIPSCRKEHVIGDPPNLPPAETFLMNFKSFSNPNDTLLSESFEDSTSYSTWRHALNTINEWKDVADFPIEISTTCYLEALKNTPIYIGSSTFGWPCNFIYQNSGYTASLFGNWISGEQFRVEMYISKPGLYGFESFKWFEGIIRSDWSYASWTLWESPETPVRLLRIEWNKNLTTNSGDIKYTILKRGQGQTGNYIQYIINTESYLDAGYIVFTSGNKVMIEWSTKDKNGRISDPVKFGDTGSWHCWNESLQNSTCE